MKIETAAEIDLSNYTCLKYFNTLCQYAEALGMLYTPEFQFTNPTTGLVYDHNALVKHIERAYSAYKGREGTAPLEYVLYYLDPDNIPFERLNEAANKLAKHFNASHQQQIDELTAMAAVLMVTIGYEQRKICVLRRIINQQNEKARLYECNVADAIIWSRASAKHYAKYHIDMFAQSAATGKIVFGYQMERNPKYFEYLEFKKEAGGLGKGFKKALNDNRRQLNQFLDDTQNKVPVQFLSYKLEDAGGFRVVAEGTYKRVAPIAGT